MDVRVGLDRKPSTKELMLLNCGVGEDSWESLGLTARRSSQSILKEISPGCSLEGMMLNLILQYFGHLMRRVDSLEKTLIWEGLRAGGEGDDRGWDGWMASLTRWMWVWVNSGRVVMDREAWHAVIHGVAKNWTQPSDWTELNWTNNIQKVPFYHMTSNICICGLFNDSHSDRYEVIFHCCIALSFSDN